MKMDFRPLIDGQAVPKPAGMTNAAPYSGTARTGGFGSASGSRRKKSGFSPTRRSSGVYYQPLETQKGNSDWRSPCNL